MRHAMRIYKILRDAEWKTLCSQGESDGAPIDRQDGYIHFSTAPQTTETLEKHFTGEDGLILLALESEALGPALKWEPSRGGALFPHLYAPLRLADVIWSAPIAVASHGRHHLPDKFP